MVARIVWGISAAVLWHGASWPYTRRDATSCGDWTSTSWHRQQVARQWGNNFSEHTCVVASVPISADPIERVMAASEHSLCSLVWYLLTSVRLPHCHIHNLSLLLFYYFSAFNWSFVFCSYRFPKSKSLGSLKQVFTSQTFLFNQPCLSAEQSLGQRSRGKYPYFWK